MDSMMIDPPRHKRRRSPSPADYDHLDPAFTSPLDVLIKRRRKRQPGEGESGDYFTHHLDQAHRPQDHEGQPEAGPSVPYVERRRAKQWGMLNAPRPSLPNQPHSQPHLEFTPPPHTAFSRSHSHPVNHLVNSSPPHAFSQPLPQHPMSSSPIRHQPFGSSPFRSQPSNQASGQRGFSSSGSAPRVESLSVEEVEDEMDPEEMRKSWGEQYAQQNELLHSVHRQRVMQQRSQASPDHSVLETPTQYRDSYFASSPYLAPSSTRSHRSYDDHMMMTSDHDDQMMGGRRGFDHDASRQYEETNRLLAELEVVRRQRWGSDLNQHQQQQ